MFAYSTCNNGIADAWFLEIKNMKKKAKEFFFIKMDYNKEMDNPQVGTFNEFSEIEEEMIEMIMDKSNNLKIYFCNNLTNVGHNVRKKILAGSFEEPKKFFKNNFKDDYKKFCEKYKLLLDK